MGEIFQRTYCVRNESAGENSVLRLVIDSLIFHPGMCCTTVERMIQQQTQKDDTERYKETRLLGSGEISEVYLATDTYLQNHLVTLKKIKKEKLNPILRKKLNTEIAILKRIAAIPADCFVQLLDVLEDSEHVYLVMEYIEGNELFDLVDQFPYGVPEVLCMKILRQIFVAIAHLHRNNIAHRDLKLENILYNATTEQIKVIDFGFASTTENKLEDYCGSIHYISPQILNKVPFDGKKADVWALGVISFALLAVKFPFDDENDNQSNIFFQIRRGLFDVPAHFSNLARSFVEELLNPNEDARPSVEDCLDHPFLSQLLSRDHVL